MLKSWKRILTLSLALALMPCIFAGCGGKSAEPTEPAVTEPEEEKKVLRILTLGHSLAVDCGHMLNLICDTEGIGEYDEIYIGTLYYSGCPLGKHVDFLRENSREYVLYISSTKTPGNIPEPMTAISMYDALKFNYWDIIVMQGGVFEITESDAYTNGNIQTIQNYVNEHKLNPLATFAWHMPWVPPVNEELRNQYPYTPNPYTNHYETLGYSRSNYYNGITKCVEDHILTDETFQFLIPSGTAIENALSSYLEETDLHRDFVHGTDLARVIASYTWYCRIMGIDKLEQMKLDAVPVKFLLSTEDKTKDRVLTEAEKCLILESVNNALANPLQMIQSQYTQAPAQ